MNTGEDGASAPGARTILALGGHEFSRKRGNEALRDYMLSLTAHAENPRVCLLPTASGDPDDQISAFRTSLAGLPCRISHVSLFRLEHESIDLIRHLLAQDLIYVGGGSMVNLLAIWRAHGIDQVMRQAWEQGTVMVGQSAGAMCWFEWGITRSVGSASLAPGLGFIPGVLSVHYHRDADRREALLAAVRERGLEGHGIDDGAGILIRDRRVVTSVSAREEAGAWVVAPDADGGVSETRMEATPLASPRPAIDERPDELHEWRAVRALRSGRA